MRLERLSEAIPYLAAATTLIRGVRPPSLLAEVWLALGQHIEALAAADITLSRDPKNKVALREAGNMIHRIGAAHNPIAPPIIVCEPIKYALQLLYSPLCTAPRQSTSIFTRR